MEAKHTPGAWWRDGRGRTISAPRGVICECWSYMGTEEADANEALIAAAPDLLAALVVAEASVGDLNSLYIVRAAIAKATAATPMW